MNWLTRFLPPKLPAVMAQSREPLYSEQAFSRVLDYLSVVPDPDLMLQKAGIERQHLRFLELDDEVAQCVETRKDALLAVPRRLEPNQSRASKWLLLQLVPHIETLLRGVMSAVFYGYSVIEITYKADAGRIVIDRADERNIEWFRIHPVLGWRYFPNDGSGGIDGLELDPRKFFITIRHPTTRNPYGESLLSRLWFPVTWRREGWQMWLKFLETFGQPIVIGRVFDFNGFVAAMQKQGVRSVIGWQGRADDNITTINASNPGEFERLENAVTKRIQKLILGQTLTSDVGDTGSYAAAKVHADVMASKTLADSRLAEQIVQRVLDTLADLNRLPRHQFIMADDIGLEAERATRDAALLPVLQASGLKLTANYFEDRYDYRSEDLEAVETDDLGAPGEPEPATRFMAGGRILLRRSTWRICTRTFTVGISAWQTRSAPR
jgi:phage gp29-like protein